MVRNADWTFASRSESVQRTPPQTAEYDMQRIHDPRVPLWSCVLGIGCEDSGPSLKPPLAVMGRPARADFGFYASRVVGGLPIRTVEVPAPIRNMFGKAYD